jgi:hypothetical protein
MARPRACVTLLVALLAVLTLPASGPPARAEAGAARSGAKTEPRLFPIRIGGKGGYIDSTGKVVIEPRFGVAREFREGRAAVNVDAGYLGRGGKWGYIDTAGHYVFQPQLVEQPSEQPDLIGATRPARDFSEGLAAVLVGGKWGYLDRDGHIAIAPRYQAAYDFHEGLAAVQLEGRWGYIDRGGKLVIEAQFQYVAEFSEGLAAVSEPAARGGGGPVRLYRPHRPVRYPASV